MDDITKKWFWMVDYCKQRSWSPFDDYFWNLARIAYESVEGTNGK